MFSSVVNVPFSRHKVFVCTTCDGYSGIFCFRCIDQAACLYSCGV